LSVVDSIASFSYEKALSFPRKQEPSDLWTNTLDPRERGDDNLASTAVMHRLDPQ